MAAPVPVQQSTLTPLNTPDIWRSFRAEIDRLFDNFTGRYDAKPFSTFRFDALPGLRSPAVDIADEPTAFKISAEVPGLSGKDVEVSVSADTLTIKGEKRQDREETGRNLYLSERSYGTFERSFVLPDNVDREKIEASFTDGVLTVTLPKSAQAAPKKIEVKAAP